MARRLLIASAAVVAAAALVFASGLPEEYYPKVEKPKVETPRIEKGPGEELTPRLYDVNVLFGVGGVEPVQLEVATDKMVGVLERRAAGLATRSRVTSDAAGRVAVELKGCADPDRAFAILMTPGQLEFQIVAEKQKLLDLVSGVWPADRYIPYEHGTMLALTEADKGAFAGVAATRLGPGQRLIWSRSVQGISGAVARAVLATGDGMVVTGVIDSAAVTEASGQIRVDFKLGDADAAAFSGLTARHIDDHLGVVFDNEVVYTARIKERLDYYSTILAGSEYGILTMEQAEEMALLLNSGSLPAILTPLEYKVDGKARPLPAGK
jgi:preprotein translocase subunit SecD